MDGKQDKTYNGAAVAKFIVIFRQLAGLTETNDDKRQLGLQRKACLMLAGREQKSETALS